MGPLKKNADGQTAEQWLKDYLAPREQPATDVIEAGEEQGFSMCTIRRAKARIGASSAQRDRIWYWYLGVGSPAPRAKTEQPARPTTDQYGYSTVVPRVTITVPWMDVLAQIKHLRKSGLDHADIFNRIMNMAYPNSGMCEAVITQALRSNGIDVPNKILDSTVQF